MAVGVSGLGRFGVGNGDLDKGGKKNKKRVLRWVVLFGLGWIRMRGCTI